MLVGSLVVSHISSQWATWSAMIALLAIHLGTNYLAVRAVSMRTLNRQRANFVFSTYLENIDAGKRSNEFKCVPTPQEVSAVERIFERDGVLRWKGGKVLGYCKIGVPLKMILDGFSTPHSKTLSYTGSQSSDAQKLVEDFELDQYILWYDMTRRTFLIVLKQRSNTYGQLIAWMHALFLSKKMESEIMDVSLILNFIIRTHSEFKAIFPVDSYVHNAGWDIETGALETKSGTRIEIQEP